MEYSCGFSGFCKKNAKFKNVRRGLKLWAKQLPCLKAQICNVNATIDLLDIMEEMRTLTVHEWNLRDILKDLIISLLQNQNTYWKQRGKIKWVKLGDENTKFFHSRATISFRHNYISMLKDDSDLESMNMMEKQIFFGIPLEIEWALLISLKCISILMT